MPVCGGHGLSKNCVCRWGHFGVPVGENVPATPFSLLRPKSNVRFSLALDRASYEQKLRYGSSARAFGPLSYRPSVRRARMPKLNEAVFMGKYAFLSYVFGISRAR